MRALLGLVVVLVACGEKPSPGDETGGASSSSGPGESTGAVPTTGSTTGSTTGATSTTEAPTSEAGGSEGTGGPAGICPPFCQRLVECGLDGAFDGCPCDHPVGALCREDWQATAQCFVDASCDSLAQGEGECWALYDVTIEQCIAGDDGCEEFVLIGTMDPPGTCAFGEDCVDAPEKLVRCEGETCSCTIGEQPAGTCAAAGVCEDLDLTTARIAECCETGLVGR